MVNTGKSNQIVIQKCQFCILLPLSTMILYFDVTTFLLFYTIPALEHLMYTNFADSISMAY